MCQLIIINYKQLESSYHFIPWFSIVNIHPPYSDRITYRSSLRDYAIDSLTLILLLNQNISLNLLN